MWKFCFGLGLIVSLGTACRSAKTKQAGPEKIVLDFIGAFSRLEFEEAQKLGTPDTQAFLQQLEAMLGQMSAEQREEFRATAAQNMLGYQKANCQKAGEDKDRLFCYLCCDQEGKVANRAMELRRLKGAWKVHYTKESIE